MGSIGLSTAVQEEKGADKWARAALKETPLGTMDEYLRSWGAFFDHYAAQAGLWPDRQLFDRLIPYHVCQ